MVAQFRLISVMRVAITAFYRPPSNKIWKQSAKSSIHGLNFNSIRFISQLKLSSSLNLISPNKVEITKENNTPRLLVEKPTPLVIMLSWMMAEQKHLAKYSDIYIKRGFNVLTVTVTPWQLIWPTTGAKVVAVELLNFIHQNVLCTPMIIHGFSVGGYLWGEVLAKMVEDMDKYKPVLDKIPCQVWDSAVDFVGIQKGLPFAVVPNNRFLRNAMELYIAFHLNFFREKATKHYLKSSQMFHNNLVRSPALFFVSNSDPIGSPASNMAVRNSWESLGVKTQWKCWDKSKHVSHLIVHKEEYLETLNKFLNSNL